MNFSLRFGNDFIRSKASSRVIFSRFGRSGFGCFFSSFISFSSKRNLLSCQYQLTLGRFDALQVNLHRNFQLFLNTEKHNLSPVSFNPTYQSFAATFADFGE